MHNSGVLQKSYGKGTLSFLHSALFSNRDDFAPVGK